MKNDCTILFATVVLTTVFLGCAVQGAAQDVAQAPEEPVRLTLHGQLVQGGLVWTRVPPDSRVSLNGEPLTVGEGGVVAFGFGRDAKPTAELKVCIGRGACTVNSLNVRQREYRVSRVNGVPQKTVDPPSGERLQRILSEAALAREARDQYLMRQDFVSGFIWPVSGRISGVFGSQRVYNGRPGRPHYGVDVARPTGTPVVAPANAVVTLVHNDMFYSGGTLIMDHGQGISSTFIHLSKILVSKGQEVRQGDVVAEIGSTGRATGPHLDWRMNWNKVRLDPQLLVGAMTTD